MTVPPFWWLTAFYLAIARDGALVIIGVWILASEVRSAIRRRRVQ